MHNKRQSCDAPNLLHEDRAKTHVHSSKLKINVSQFSALNTGLNCVIQATNRHNHMSSTYFLQVDANI